MVPNKQGGAIDRQAAVNADVDAEGFVVSGMLRERKLGTEVSERRRGSTKD